MFLRIAFCGPMLNVIYKVDIIEGVNGIQPNQATLHTSSGCTMPSNTTQTGYVLFLYSLE